MSYTDEVRHWNVRKHMKAFSYSWVYYVAKWSNIKLGLKVRMKLFTSCLFMNQSAAKSPINVSLGILLRLERIQSKAKSHVLFQRKETKVFWLPFRSSERKCQGTEIDQSELSKLKLEPRLDLLESWTGTKRLDSHGKTFLSPNKL